MLGSFCRKLEETHLLLDLRQHSKTALHTERIWVVTLSGSCTGHAILPRCFFDFRKTESLTVFSIKPCEKACHHVKLLATF